MKKDREDKGDSIDLKALDGDPVARYYFAAGVASVMASDVPPEEAGHQFGKLIQATKRLHLRNLFPPKKKDNQ